MANGKYCANLSTLKVSIYSIRQTRHFHPIIKIIRNYAADPGKAGRPRPPMFDLHQSIGTESNDSYY